MRFFNTLVQVKTQLSNLREISKCRRHKPVSSTKVFKFIKVY